MDDVRGTDADRHQRLTVARLLEERALRAARVVGTSAELDRAASWCLPWEQAVAGTAPLCGIVVYARPRDVDAAALRSLARRGPAAVVVAGELAGLSTGATAGGAGGGDVAAALGPVPLVVATEGLGYFELSRLVAELTLAREAHVLRYGLTVHRSLAELLYRGAGLDALCHQMARLSRCAVAILDRNFHVLAAERGRERPLDPSALAGALRAAAPALPEDPSVHPTPRVVELHVDGAPATCVVSPIVLGGRHDGWVLVVESAQPPHPHDIAEHQVVVEQAVTIVGTEMLRRRSVEQAEERARGDFVHALLHGRFADPTELAARAAHYDFPVDAGYGVVVAGNLGATGTPESLSALGQLARDATRLMPRPSAHTLATVVGDLLAVIRPVDAPARGEHPDTAQRALAGYAEALEGELVRRLRHPVLVAYGRPVTGAGSVYDSYREARITLELRRRLGISAVCGFQDLRMFATVYELATSERGRAFAADVLTPLRANRGGAADLERAVLTYIESGGNLNAAARDLHIHRNTMLYKLDRASRLLHLDLRRAEHQFTVWLAFTLDLLAETTTAVDRDLRPGWPSDRAGERPPPPPDWVRRS